MSNSTPYLIATVILISTCSYILFIPTTDVFTWADPYNEKRLLECLLLVFIAVFTLLIRRWRHAWLTAFFSLSRQTRYLLLLFLSIGILSSVQAVSVSSAVLEISLYCLLFIACLSLAVTRQQMGTAFEKIVASVLLAVGWSFLVGFLAFYLNYLKRKKQHPKPPLKFKPSRRLRKIITL